MGQIRLEGNRAVKLEIRRSARARRISLRVSSLDGRVTLTVPPGVSDRKALAFAEEKAEWIGAALGRQAPPVAVGPGVVLPVEGLPRLVVAGTGRRACLGPDEIAAPSGREGPAILALLKDLARARLVAEVDRQAVRIGRQAARVTLRDPRSRWGSCTAEGNLMFSWRLIMAPPDVLAYVAAHEVAHLARMDHSPAFWAEVDRLHPGHGRQRAWLRGEGAALHRFRFRAVGD